MYKIVVMTNNVNLGEFSDTYVIEESSLHMVLGTEYEDEYIKLIEYFKSRDIQYDIL